MGRKKIKPVDMKALMALEYGSEEMNIPPRPIVHLTMREYVDTGKLKEKMDNARKAILGIWK